jgi:glycosyltransferase involved in cell wall biosynthesis
MSKVTVIIPTYNRAYILSQAIASVLAQTMGDFELIIVDDGSTDGTAGVVSGFPDARIRYIRQANAGPGMARNRGVAEATSPYVSFLDSDDLWMPDKLSSCLTFLSNHPEVGGIFHDAEWRCGDEVRGSFVRSHSARMLAWLAGVSYPEGTIMPDRELQLMLLQEVPIKTPTLTVDTRAFKTIGGFNSWACAEDWEFLLRFAKRNRLAYLDRPLGVIRVTPDSAHFKEVGRNFTAVCELLSNQRSLIPSQDTEALAAISAGITEAATGASWRYLERGKRLAAINTCLIGFARTGNVELLLRALGVCLPISLFQAGKILYRGRSPSRSITASPRIRD